MLLDDLIEYLAQDRGKTISPLKDKGTSLPGEDISLVEG